MKYISVSELNKHSENYYIVDIRERYEYEFGNIGSVNIPMGEVFKRLEELPKDKHIVFMCKSGKRASALVNLLITEFHLENCSIMEGGIEAWQQVIPDLTIE